MTWCHAEVSAILCAAPRRSTALPHRCSSCAARGRGRIAQSRGSGLATRRSGGEADPVTGCISGDTARRVVPSTSGAGIAARSTVRPSPPDPAAAPVPHPTPVASTTRSPFCSADLLHILRQWPPPPPPTQPPSLGGNCVAVPSYSCRWPATSFLYKFPSGWASISLPPGLHLIFP